MPALGGAHREAVLLASYGVSKIKKVMPGDTWYRTSEAVDPPGRTRYRHVYVKLSIGDYVLESQKQ